MDVHQDGQTSLKHDAFSHHYPQQRHKNITMSFDYCRFFFLKKRTRHAIYAACMPAHQTKNNRVELGLTITSALSNQSQIKSEKLPRLVA